MENLNSKQKIYTNYNPHTEEIYEPQFLSSDPSGHSGVPSHTLTASTQSSVLEHLCWVISQAKNRLRNTYLYNYQEQSLNHHQHHHRQTRKEIFVHTSTRNNQVHAPDTLKEIYLRNL